MSIVLLSPNCTLNIQSDENTQKVEKCFSKGTAQNNVPKFVPDPFSSKEQMVIEEVKHDRSERA